MPRSSSRRPGRSSYGRPASKVPYTAEGHYAAAIPASGYLWDRAAAAGVSYRSYGEFANNGPAPADPATTAVPALRGHIDPYYRCWDLTYHDVDRAARFIEELHRFEAAGDMPRLQILRLPQDHTDGAQAGAWTPRAMAADNDLALGSPRRGGEPLPVLAATPRSLSSRTTRRMVPTTWTRTGRRRWW